MPKIGVPKIFDHIWTILWAIKFWPKIAKNGQKGPKIAKKWPKMVKNGQKWPKSDGPKNGPKMVKNLRDTDFRHLEAMN